LLSAGLPAHHEDAEIVRPPSATDRPIGRLLRLSQSADPDALVETLSLAVAVIGGSDLVLYLMDYERVVLMPHPDRLPHGNTPERATVDGSMAGRAFMSGEPLAIERSDGWQVWIPVTERANQLGVLSMTLPEWDDDIESYCIELGTAAAHLVVTSSHYTDLPHLLRRRRDMDLAAEMQWSLLPPIAFMTEQTTVAGLLEPAYEVGGDSFDYALNERVIDLAVFDAVGHGLASSVLASLLMGAYRHGRRNGEGLHQLAASIDRAVREVFGPATFATALLARFDVRSGRLSWLSCGHPAPIIVRRGSTLDEVTVRPILPLGLGYLAEVAGEIGTVDLEPGDGVLLYTDGVVEARSATGEIFGEERLRDLLAREHLAGGRPQEVVRRLVRSTMSHAGTRLRDDASMLYLRWDGSTTRADIGRRRPGSDTGAAS
jgi:serine phosphatase RsbU (regulator of sigma subunit)